MFDKARLLLLVVDYCFTLVDGTFIRVFGAYMSPHQFPLFISDKVVLQEVEY